MARVYKVHHYTDVIAAKAYLLSGFKKGRFRDNAINAACDEDYISLRAECDEVDSGLETESRREDAVAMVAMREGIDRVMTYANANTVVYHENGWSFQDILCGANAVSYMYEGFLSGRYGVTQVASLGWRDFASVAKSVFVAGCIVRYGGYNECLALDVTRWVELHRKF